MQEEGKISKYRALIDTSSVVAHDLCAQLHVLQFCVEELENHVSSEGREFLEKMGDSTTYIASLVETFRKHLKITLNDEDPTSLEKVYRAALELVKNHFFVILESVEFKVTGDLESTLVKADSRKLMNIIFSLYSMALEDLKATQDFSGRRVSIGFSISKDNDRFATLDLSFRGFEFRPSWPFYLLENLEPEKGQLRKFLGQSLIREKIIEDSDFFKSSQTEVENRISLKVALHHQ